jgi:hypothetical protein
LPARPGGLEMLNYFGIKSHGFSCRNDLVIKAMSDFKPYEKQSSFGTAHNFFESAPTLNPKFE